MNILLNSFLFLHKLVFPLINNKITARFTFLIFLFFIIYLLFLHTKKSFKKNKTILNVLLIIAFLSLIFYLILFAGWFILIYIIFSLPIFT